LEQQAKERLTGGVILVVLLVALVPELLTGPRAVPSPTPAQPDQAPMRSYTMDLGESPHVNSAPVAASTAAPSAREAAVAVSSAPEPVPLPAAATAAPQVATPAAPVAARARAPARTVERGTAVWAVQLGTFSDRENAARLVARLKSHGFSAAISEATKNSHKLFRVRVGTERDRAAAQKLLARLKAAGEKGGEIVLH
jgi:DedD protein